MIREHSRKAGNMAGKTIMVLGGGMGGLAVAQQLRTLLPSEHRVVVVEKESAFYMCTFNMRLMTGEMKARAERERPLSGLAGKGIEWGHGEVLELYPKTRRVRTSTGTLEGHILVDASVATGKWCSRASRHIPPSQLRRAGGALRLHE